MATNGMNMEPNTKDRFTFIALGSLSMQLIA